MHGEDKLSLMSLEREGVGFRMKGDLKPAAGKRIL